MTELQTDVLGFQPRPLALEPGCTVVVRVLLYSLSPGATSAVRVCSGHGHISLGGVGGHPQRSPSSGLQPLSSAAPSTPQGRSVTGDSTGMCVMGVPGTELSRSEERALSQSLWCPDSELSLPSHPRTPWT